MKNLVGILALAGMLPTAAKADITVPSTEQRVHAAYLGSPEAKAFRDQIVDRQRGEERLESVTIGGICGFAGCESEVLVVHTFAERVVNASTVSQLAVVSLPALGEPTVRMVELNPQESVTVDLGQRDLLPGATSAFESLPAVASKIKEWTREVNGAMLMNVEGTRSFVIGGQCGFAGCSEEILLVKTARMLSYPAIIDSLFGFVSVPPYEQNTITIAPATIGPQD